MRTHDTNEPTTAAKPPRKRETGATPVQRKVLDLQRQAGNAAVADSIGELGREPAAAAEGATNVQRHRLDPEHADE